MRYPKMVLGGLVLLATCLPWLRAQAPSAVLFEGARLIVGDGKAPIENSAFLVENNRFTKVGKKGEMQAPAGAARVDLTGKTVIPALVDAHTHLGWAVIKTGKIGKDTYTKENLIDHLQRIAYFGVAATQTMGIDPGEAAFEIGRAHV